MLFLKDFLLRIKEFFKNQINLYLDQKAHALQKEWSQNSNILLLK